MKILTYLTLSLAVFFSITQNVFSQNYWSQLNGPYGGNVIDLKKHPNGNLYALRSEGLYVSTDSGDNWNEVNQASVNSNLSMDISPSGVIYVGKSSGGIWWTSNLGQSWSFNPIHIAPHSGLWTTVIITKINPAGYIFINSHVSFNGGQTFTQFTDNSIGLSSDYAFNGTNQVYSASYTGIFHSVNNGASWTNINGNLPSINATSLLFDNNILIAGINGSGVFKTSDNGTTWQAINNGLTDLNINKLYKDAQNNYYVSTSTGNIFKSSDFGALWIQIFNSTFENRISSIYAEGNLIYNTSANLGISKSTDNGSSWVQKNYNLFLPGISSFAFGNGSEIFGVSGYGMIYSPDNGASWETRGSSLPTTFINSIYRDEAGFLMTGLRRYGIYRSDNNGISWESSSQGISPQGVFKNIKHSPNGFIYATSSPINFPDSFKVYLSSDNGFTWEKVFQQSSIGLEYFFTIDNAGTLYLAGTNSSFETTVLNSTDNGQTWNENILKQFFMINNFTSSENKLYFIFSNNVYTSTDMGASLNQLNNGGWETSNIGTIAVNSLQHIFITAGSSFYVTTDNGNTWTQQNSGLPSAQINTLQLDDAGYLYGITYYDGIFRSLNSTLTSVTSQSNYSPEGFSLKQNYPNPFNPSTIIRYEIPSNITGQTSNVQLIIYDALGKEIATLVNESQYAGSYEVTFEGSNFASGVYYYKLKTENFEKVMKMILLK